jgi:hypothetical protein
MLVEAAPILKLKAFNVKVVMRLMNASAVRALDRWCVPFLQGISEYQDFPGTKSL